ncbi:3-oxoacyl-[acyl-carrier-protein] reductase [Candidatus Woesearchaeota archaeon]|nr:3-oxoacyl-[acyl-carrier-protein] reductase [Candidatus Woesearchaeota archaeon]
MVEETKEETAEVALVTGSLRGIGRAIALELAKNGADIVVNNSKFLPEGEELANEIRKIGRKSTYIPTDISNYQKVEEMVKQIIEEYGKINILINNAGITRDKKLENMGVEMWDQVISTNLTGTFNCTKAVIKQMQKQGGGKIVNISSIVGETGNIGQANYAATKGGIIAFTKTIAKEYAKDKILVNAVAPGFINTKMTETIPPGTIQDIMRQIPLQRFGEPEEVAKLVHFLISDKSNYITGQTFNINGGLFMS